MNEVLVVLGGQGIFRHLSRPIHKKLYLESKLRALPILYSPYDLVSCVYLQAQFTSIGSLLKYYDGFRTQSYPHSDEGYKT